MTPRIWVRALAVLALATCLAGCHFYFEDGDDDDDVLDASLPPWDADRPPFPDGDLIQPDAGGCETVDDFLARFAGCMDFTEWQDLGMCDVPLETTTPGDTCADCHADGTAMTFMATNCEDTWSSNRFQPYILGLIQPTEDADGCFNAFLPGKWLETPAAGHPPFTLSETARTAINSYVSTTFTRYADSAQSCPPPKAP